MGDALRDAAKAGPALGVERKKRIERCQSDHGAGVASQLAAGADIGDRLLLLLGHAGHDLASSWSPVTKEFGWGRTLFASGVSIATFTTAIASPFLGIIVDKWGARAAGAAGAWC
jgi:hypothetical protein